MKNPVNLFKREGKRWLPSFMVNEPSKAKECLEMWADSSNFPTQVEIAEILAKAENILLRVEDLECKEMTRDFTEAMILFISAFNEFLQCHNVDNAIRDFLVSCAKIVLLLIDPLSLDNSFGKLRKTAERSSQSAYDSERVKKERREIKRSFRKRIAVYLEETRRISDLDNVRDSTQEVKQDLSEQYNKETEQFREEQYFSENLIDNKDIPTPAKTNNNDEARNNQNKSDENVPKKVSDEAVHPVDIATAEIDESKMEKSIDESEFTKSPKSFTNIVEDEHKDPTYPGDDNLTNYSQRSSDNEHNGFESSSSSLLMEEMVTNDDKKNNDKSRKIRDITNRLRKKLKDKVLKGKIKQAKRSLWSIMNDPELKALWDEFTQILKHLIEAIISGRIVSGKYSIEPLKALKNRRSFVYGGISSALENALNAPQASTLKQIAMASVEVPATFIIGAGYGMRAAYLESNERISYINDLITTESLNKHPDEGPNERYPESEKAKVLMSIMLTPLRRAKSLSNMGGKTTISPVSGYVQNLYTNVVNKRPNHNKKENFELDDAESRPVKFKLKRSRSFGEAMIEERKEPFLNVNPCQKSLDEWFFKNEMYKHEQVGESPASKESQKHLNDPEIILTEQRHDVTEMFDDRNYNNSESHFSKNEDSDTAAEIWDFKESMNRFKDIGKRTRIISSVRSTLLRRGSIQHVKTNIKDLFNPKMRSKLVNIIDTIEHGNYSILIGAIAHLFNSYSEKTTISSERKKLVECFNKLLKTLTSQESIDTLFFDLKELRNSPTYTSLKVIMSLRRDKNNSEINVESIINNIKDDLSRGTGYDNHNATGEAVKEKQIGNGSYAKALAENIIDLVESNEGRNVIADILDIYMSIKLENNRKRLAKAFRLLRATYKHHGVNKPHYIIIIELLKDLLGKAVPHLLKESRMISIPLHKATEIKGFELFFTKEPCLSIHDIKPDKFKICLEHRTTNVEDMQRIIRMENDKHVLVPEPVRNFVKFILKVFPLSVERFHKWDISEGEKGPKWFVNVTLKGIHFVLKSEEVRILATDRYKGTPGNYTYKMIKSCNKIIPKRKKKNKPISNDANVELKGNEACNEKILLMNNLVAERDKAYIFNNKKSYKLWKGKVDGMVYGEGITIDLIFETVTRNEDDLQNANILVKKLHRKLSHSEVIKKGKHQKLRRKSKTSHNTRTSIKNDIKSKVINNLNNEKSNDNTNKSFFTLNKYIINSLANGSENSEFFHLAGVRVNVPYYSSRLRVKGAMGSVISIVAEKKLRELIKEGMETHIIKLLSKFNYERSDIAT